MLGEYFADERETALILRQFGLAIVFDFDDLASWPPGNQKIWRIAMLCLLVVVFEDERLLLPCVGTRGCHQYLKCSQFILGFGVA
jgi:hypothetical protein